MSKGDSEALHIHALNDETFNDGDIIKFTVKRNVNETEGVIEKSVTVVGNNTTDVLINLTKDDTDLEIGNYVYDIRIVNGSVCTTPYKYKRFSIIATVGDNNGL